MKHSINYPGSSMLTGRGVEPGLPCAGEGGSISSLSAAKQEGFQSWLGAMELPVETDCGGRAQGRCVSQPELESTHPPPLVVFLTLFSSLPGYVAAKAKVYKFLSLPLSHCSRFRRFDDHSLPPGILSLRGLRFWAPGLVYFSPFWIQGK